MIPTYRGIYIPGAFHFEHAVNAKQKKERKHQKINKSNSKLFLLHDEIAKN